MTIQPLRDAVLVKPLDAEDKTKGGIVLPDTAKEKPQKGEIIAVGGGRVTEDGKVISLEVKKGNKILFRKYSGTEVEIDNETHLIMREEDILALIT